MRHYEIMLLIHPDQSERARVMMDRYVGIIEGGQGQVHRNEDLGRRMLAYPIAKVQKAHYMLLNVECGQDTLDELVGALHFSDAVLRHLVVRRDEAVTDKSVLARAAEKEAARESREFPYDKELAHGRRGKREEAGETDDKAKAAAVDAPASEDEPEAAAEPEAVAEPESDAEPESEAAATEDAAEPEADPAPEASDEPAEAEDEPADAAEDDQAADEAAAAGEEATDSSADETAAEADDQTGDESGESDTPGDDAAAGDDEDPKEEKE